MPVKKTASDTIANDVSREAKKIKITEIDKLSTGSTVFDLVLGGGMPIGKIVNIVGDNSTGKTLIACEIIAAARRKYGDKVKWRYNDAEAGFSFDSRTLYGIDIIDEEKTPSATIEEFESDLDAELSTLGKDEIMIYVLDSLDALSSLSEIEAADSRRKAIASGKDVKGTYGMGKQKFLSEFFRLKATAIKDHRCLLVIISQVRENIGVMYGPKYRRSGGKALDFYAAQIIWLAEAEKKEAKGRAYGITVKTRVTKNKVGLPFRSGFLDVLFDMGVDDISSNLIYLCNARTDLGKMKKSATISFGDKSGDLDDVIAYVEENNLEGALQEAVIAKWNAIDAAISSNDRKKRY